MSGRKCYGFTASAICSVNGTPATFLVCIFPAFANTRYFCVNTRMPNQQDLSDALGGKTPAADRFTYSDWREGADRRSRSSLTHR